MNRADPAGGVDFGKVGWQNRGSESETGRGAGVIDRGDARGGHRQAERGHCGGPGQGSGMTAANCQEFSHVPAFGGMFR